MAASRFRADIEGLRAVAVLMILAYHAGFAPLHGGYVGVDVFLVISGFLITRSLVSSIENRSMRFGAFYARRIRRLVPASLLVLVLSIALGLVLVPPLERSLLLRDAAATAAYVPNFLFAWRGTDYLAGTTPSLFQHYWSLALEEQFYLIWPLLIVAGMWGCRSSRSRLTLVLASVTVASFVLGIWLTEWRQSWAFFLLPARAWEFGVGGLVALAVLHRPALLRSSPSLTACAWLGMGVVLVSGFAFSSATSFPSWTAAVPTIATALVILGGSSPSKTGPVVLLGTRPMQFVGKISYSLYLVHWPLLVLPQMALDWSEPLPTWAVWASAVGSVPLAWLCWRFVEEPGRRKTSWWNVTSRRAIGVALVASLLVALASQVASDALRDVPLSSSRAATPQPLLPNPAGTPFVPTNMTPALHDTAADVASVYSNGCHLDLETSDPAQCSYGENVLAPRVVLFGDSHAATWFGALSMLAEQGEIRLDVHTKSGCPSADIEARLSTGARYPECDLWRANVLRQLVQEPPHLVVLANFTGFHSPSVPAWDIALETTIEALAPSTRTIVVEDVPAHSGEPATCLSRNLDDALACAPRALDVIDAEANELDRLAALATGAGYLSVNEWLCSVDCPVIIGTTMIYRDGHHLTDTASRAFSSNFAGAISRELGLP